MKSNHRHICLFIGGLPMLAASLLSPLAGCRRTNSDNPGSRQDEGIPVEVVRVRPATLRETVRGIGTLRAAETVEIKPEISGIICEISFTEGGQVEKEQRLFSIDDKKLRHRLAAAQAALGVARARLDNAQREFKRLRGLIERDAATRDEFDEASTDFRAATAEVERLKSEVDLVRG